MLRHGTAPAGPGADRHPRWRRRSDLSASRKRDCAERRRHAATVFTLLGTRRAPDDRDRTRGRGEGPGEDVEVARQCLQPPGHRRTWIPAVRAPLFVPWSALSEAAEVLLDGDGAGGGSAEAVDRLPRATGFAARA